ncbi:MAG: glycosyltransferase [Chromatiaceae bacterium]|nr:glycosyltransferase [Chromatiaceae bacterium]MCP5422338.1 glycosyltransferase [Chromatiaceae bacterium]
MKRVLMIAYHFPPLAGSSGIQRTLRFVRYLPEYGWEPVVLTAHERAYAETSDDQLKDVPEGVRVIRAPAWDTSRHFAVGGRYPRFLSLPDRWVSWWLGGVWCGSRLLRQSKFDAIWSTYPIATAHMLGASLAARSGLPWIADFRDPMAQPDYPVDKEKRKRFFAIERRAVNSATFSTFTTPSAAETYRVRYPDRAASIRLLENGYDEETFADAAKGEALSAGRLTLLHSGIVYPVERDPSSLFRALGYLRRSEPEIYRRINVRFRAPVHEDLLRRLAAENNVDDAVEIMPPIDYRSALQEMCSADALLVLQAANCNEQIPAKLYEYMRAGRPVLVLSDPSGDTATASRMAGIGAIARLDDAAEIADRLIRFVRNPNEDTLPNTHAVRAASRRERTQRLAGLLDSLAGAQRCE